MSPWLTIGMATYDDFDGVFFTIQALRLHQADELDGVELVIVDNNPNSEKSRMLQDFAFNAGARYIPYNAVAGTAAPRNRVFEEAQGEWVLCLDSHVLLQSGSLKKLRTYTEQNPNSRDLLQGPMILDHLQAASVEFNSNWGPDGMLGQWVTVPWDSRTENPVREIRAQGLGLFSCRKAAWPGFHRCFRGFGGEEHWIQEKIRQSGGKALLLPFLGWIHRFKDANVENVKYRLSIYDKARNYVIGHRDLDWPLDQLIETYKKKLPAEELDRIIQSVDQWRKFGDPMGCPSCHWSTEQPASLVEWQRATAKRPSDINQHSDLLRDLAAKAKKTVSFSHRHDVSTVALLAGGNNVFVYDPIRFAEYDHLQSLAPGKLHWEPLLWSNAPIERCDLLFLDLIPHNAALLWGLLDRHGRAADRIVIHDTVTFGEQGEGGGPGLLPAIRRFVQENPDWTVIESLQNNNGLMLISRLPGDKKKTPGLIAQGATFLKAVVRHVADGGNPASDEEYERRLEVCAMCSVRNGEQCGQCGCVIAKKARWASELCPLGHWMNEAING